MAEFFAPKKVLYFFIDGTRVSKSQYDYSNDKAKKKTMCVTMSARLVTDMARTIERDGLRTLPYISSLSLPKVSF